MPVTLNVVGVESAIARVVNAPRLRRRIARNRVAFFIIRCSSLPSGEWGWTGMALTYIKEVQSTGQNLALKIKDLFVEGKLFSLEWTGVY